MLNIRIVYNGVDRLLAINKKTLDDGSVYHECWDGDSATAWINEKDLLLGDEIARQYFPMEYRRAALGVSHFVAGDALVIKVVDPAAFKSFVEGRCDGDFVDFEANDAAEWANQVYAQVEVTNFNEVLGYRFGLVQPDVIFVDDLEKLPYYDSQRLIRNILDHHNVGYQFYPLEGNNFEFDLVEEDGCGAHYNGRRGPDGWEFNGASTDESNFYIALDMFLQFLKREM